MREVSTSLIAALKPHLTAGNQSRSDRKLWVSRRKADHRRIANEEKLYPILKKYGFEIVLAEDLSFYRQIEVFTGASVIAGMHGAGLTNMVFMPPDSAVIEVRQAGDRQNNCYFSLADALRHRYNYVIAEPTESNEFNFTHSVSTEALDEALKSV